ncbi:MAG: acyl-homoserine-lactone synthase [Xanthobacteraceae bacterium]
MIEAFSLKTAHHFGDALASQARLRYQVFVQHRALPHTHYDGMEYDEFDTPAAVYLVWRDPNLIVRGLLRLSPTTVPYMLEKNWPYLCQRRDLPKSPWVWEATRVCVDRTYPSRIRQTIMPALLCAVEEFGLQNDIRATVGVTRKHLLDHYLGAGVEWLGDTMEIEGEQEAAFWIPTENMRPWSYCAKLGLPDRVLSFEPLDRRIAA